MMSMQKHLLVLLNTCMQSKIHNAYAYIIYLCIYTYMHTYIHTHTCIIQVHSCMNIGIVINIQHLSNACLCDWMPHACNNTFILYMNTCTGLLSHCSDFLRPTCPSELQVPLLLQQHPRSSVRFLACPWEPCFVWSPFSQFEPSAGLTRHAYITYVIMNQKHSNTCELQRIMKQLSIQPSLVTRVQINYRDRQAVTRWPWSHHYDTLVVTYSRRAIPTHTYIHTYRGTRRSMIRETGAPGDL